MNSALLVKFERAVTRRNPHLARMLQPGLSKGEVKRLLDSSGITGDIGALIELYSWKNGLKPGPKISLTEASLFPQSVYQFLSLQEAVELSEKMQKAAVDLVQLTGDPTSLSQGIGHYFPVFWDNSSSSIGVDISPSASNRVVRIDFESEQPFREVYDSFGEFIEDAIRANQQLGHLTCIAPR